MSYAPYIQKSIDYHNRSIEDLRSLEGTARVLERCKAAINEEIIFDTTTFGSDALKLVLKPRSVRELAAAMRVFRGRGLKIETVEDEPDNQRRVYGLFHTDDSLNKYPSSSGIRKYYPAVRVEAYFDAADGECKYVQVGSEEEVIPAREEQVITKPVFELKCGDETAEAV